VAHSLSARKRIRQDIRRRARNRWRKDQVKQATKQFEAAMRTGNADQAAQQLRLLYKKVDQVAAKGAIHKNAAARKKSRLAKRLNQLAK
jgi:small subunit ribosomal protein S20